MGLDMYLTAKKYLSPYSEGKLHEKVNKAIKKLDITGQGEMQIKQLECEAIYWRKGNAIHAWFVKNAQNGNDDCGYYYVSIDQLKELENICDQILLDRNRAIELLPPQPGFFFGSTDLDEYYYKDIEETKGKISKLLATPGINNWDFYYHSSW
jgi:hypothetical protein